MMQKVMIDHALLSKLHPALAEVAQIRVLKENVAGYEKALKQLSDALDARESDPNMVVSDEVALQFDIVRDVMLAQHYDTYRVELLSHQLDAQVCKKLGFKYLDLNRKPQKEQTAA